MTRKKHPEAIIDARLSDVDSQSVPPDAAESYEGFHGRPGEGALEATLIDRPEPSDELGAAIPILPFPFPLVRSGRYHYSQPFQLPPILIPGPPLGPTLGLGAGEAVYSEDVSAIALYQQEEIHLDVDGRYPQMTISGTRSGPLAISVHWVASVTKTGPSTYSGPIWYKNGNAAAIPHSFVTATVSGGPFPGTLKLAITFTGGGGAAFTRTYAYQSAYHRKVEFEYDRVSNATAVTAIATHAHPNRPATLPSETLSIENVFRRTGFDVSMSGGNNVIPLAASGPDALWTDAEMHDAMQVHWSRFANKPQWSMWVLFAALHQSGTGLGGVMFDDIGPNHRQGTAIFSNAFIANAPAGDPNPAAWVARMRFWTAVHEMGHAFNLAHSWQKAASINLPGNPWIPLANEPAARSFMNYPYNVAGGQQAFFSDFQFRFSDAELLFMRHAPARFVQMGNEAWFTNHGFREASRDSNPDYELRLSVTAEGGRFDYLAPPVVEIALINRSGRPKVMAGERLAGRAGFTLIINREGSTPARQWLPHLRHCAEDGDRVVQPGQALFDSIMVGTGRNGWDMAEPGRYCLQALLEIDGSLVYSNQISVTVAPPASREEERLAADFFTPEVGQVLAVNGSRAMEGVNAILAEAVELPDNPVSALAAAALATPLSHNYKLLEIGGGRDSARATADGAEAPDDSRIGLYRADPGAVRELVARATEGGADRLVNAMGHARFLRDAPLLAGILVEEVPEGLSAFGSADSATLATEALPLSEPLAARLRRKRATLTD